jgi:hypothetical protein
MNTGKLDINTGIVLDSCSEVEMNKGFATELSRVREERAEGQGGALMAKATLVRRLRWTIRQWWACRMKTCSYYEHYLVYGPANLTHIGWHKAERKGEEHFKNCSQSNSGRGPCTSCINWERRLRA